MIKRFIENSISYEINKRTSVFIKRNNASEKFEDIYIYKEVDYRHRGGYSVHDDGKCYNLVKIIESETGNVIREGFLPKFINNDFLKNTGFMDPHIGVECMGPNCPWCAMSSEMH